MALAFFSFYPADFVADTQHLTPEQVGAYIRILCFLWQKGKAKESHLKAVGFGSVQVGFDQWEDVGSLLETDGIFFWSRRLEQERENCEKRHKAQVENGKKGGRPRRETQQQPTENPRVFEDEPTGLDWQTHGPTNHNHNHSSINTLSMDERRELHSPGNPDIENCRAFAEMHFPQLDFETWFKHWNAVGWIDNKGHRFDWKSKMAWNAKSKEFQKSIPRLGQERPGTPQKGRFNSEAVLATAGANLGFPGPSIGK